ncbi:MULTISPECIES: flagellar protein FlaG [Pseudomonadati]|uniref:Flagellar protein FlaG n=1 Tax=Shewanella aestuarii TaxID=1028752 RepID=A0ABT0L2N9_9GAMM|nr:flagellar protein FlaG [Shewanella aestuarii]MCL1117760.1 flagellar protein FlaG [Shewanella aestuarii]GGN76867.1 flagella locus protein FlaG [Shewanella aestuarii]
MEIQTNNSASFIARAETTKSNLNSVPLNTKNSETKQVELDRVSTVQAVKQQEETATDNRKSNESLDVVAKELTDMVAMMQKGLKFSVDEESGKQVIKVQDIDSGDIIRQIPSEEALQLAEKLSEVSGILMKIEV